MFEEGDIRFVMAVTEEFFLLACSDRTGERSIFLYIYYGWDDAPEELPS